jgi:hypothetical protein
MRRVACQVPLVEMDGPSPLIQHRRHLWEYSTTEDVWIGWVQACVLVHSESWGSQLLTRGWAASRSSARRRMFLGAGGLTGCAGLLVDQVAADRGGAHGVGTWRQLMGSTATSKVE